MRLIVFGDYHYVSDNYYGENKDVFDYSETQRSAKKELHKFLIDNLFKEYADYYISLGDLVNYSRKDEISDVYDQIEATGKMDRFIHVYGNHDLYFHSAEELKEITGQNYNYSIETPLVKMIFLKSARDCSPENWTGYVDETVMNFLKEELKSSKNKRTIVFAHHPIYDTVADSNSYRRSIDPEIDMWEVLKVKKSGGLFVAGHTHYDSITDLNNWDFINLGAVLDRPRYAVFDIDENEINMEMKFIELSDDLDKKRILVGSNIPHFWLRTNGVGTSPNLRTTIQNQNRLRKSS